MIEAVVGTPKKGLKRKEGRVFKHGSISMEW
jgi:hypothetical protein